MVYHQPTPLIVKKEQSSQAQFCTPLRTTAAEQFDQLNIQTHAFGGGSSLIMQEQRQAPPSSITLAQIQQGLKNVPNQTFLNAIKAELLPPSITLYPTSTNHAHNPASAAPVLPPSIPMPTLAPSLAPSSTTTPSTKAAAATSARSGATPPTTTQKGRGKSGANKTQFKCDQCGMTFGSKSAHTSHTKSHAKSGELIDSGLDMSAVQINGLELNEAGMPLGIPKTPQIKPNAAAAGGGDPYQCNVCQKTFAVPARLIRHYRTHTGERPFECEFCHKLFSVKENLQVHRRIHTKERPYKCEVCGRAFEHSGKLHRHMRIHTGERPHKCSVCEKTFIQSGQLVIHMRTHTGEKPYKCPVEGCGKGFTCSKQLKVHSRTHTGEKPYHCDICFRDFGYNHVLKLHRVQHYGSKCYKCTICDETFKSKKEMEAHIKGHANELPDDEEDTVGVSGTSTGGSDQVAKASSSSSSASSGESMSPPASPLSPAVSVPPRANRHKQNAQSAPLGSPTYHGSPMAPLSPTSSLTSAAASHFSAGSPSSSSVTSPTMSLTIETDHHSHDSGVVSTSSSTMRHQAAALGQASAVAAGNDEMPTDLSVQQEHQHQSEQHTHTHHQQQQPPPPPPMKYYQLQTQQASPVYHEQTPSPYATTYHRGAVPEQRPQTQPQQQTHYVHSQQSHDVTPPTHEEPTISPALLEAASIRRALMEPREEQETQAALQILQLKRSHQQQQQQQQQQHYQHLQQQQHHQQQGNAMTQYDDAQEANELIEHYKRGELARHGIHKGYAPVPKFEPSLLNNETIVRQVEAAIAPLRSSTESPERSSSPESDSMMMADRDVMTLPLRKRKLYMSQKDTTLEEPSAITGDTTSAENLSGSANCDVNTKVMRMSSVIQFAKAS